MRVIVCTAPPGGGERLLRSLLEERLVACGNILGGVRSLYWWDGAVQDEAEELLLMETTAEDIAEKIQRIRELHPYEVPKILALEPTDVLAAYRDWARAETRPIPR